MRLLWGWTPAGTRGPRPSLDLGQVASAAIAVADAEGLGAVSMQKVAERLGVSKMALYRYVSSKDELVAVAVEEAVGDAPVTTPADGGWRDRTRVWAEALRAVWEEHPWLPATAVGNRIVGPREIAWSESAARALAGSGLAGAELRATITLLFAHARATLVREIAGTQYWATSHDVGVALRERLSESRARFPALAAAEEGPGDADAWDYGLEVILDGVAARTRRRRR